MPDHQSQGGKQDIRMLGCHDESNLQTLHQRSNVVTISPAVAQLSEKYLANCLWEFQQIYDLGAVGDKEELITF